MKAKTMNTVNTREEMKRREYILNGPQFKVIFSIAMPLVFYNTMRQVFLFIDTLIAANMSAKVVSTVSFISQIQTMLSAIAGGLSVGGGIIISRYFGAGKMEEVKSRISTLFFLCLAIGAVILAAAIPGAYPLLRILRMPKDLLSDGAIYFILEIIGLLSLFINTIYLSIEKSRGNTQQIVWYNMGVLVIKTGMTMLFVYVLHGGMFMLPLATIAAQGFLTIIAIANMTSRHNPFRLSIKSCHFRAYILKPLFSLSTPIFMERFIFAFGKVIVNSMCASYGTTVVGALGVSDRVGALATQPPSGFQEAESSLISQNLGAGNRSRALGIFYRVFLINIVFSAIMFFITGVFKERIINLFAKGDVAFAAEVSAIYTWERLDTLLISMNTSVMGLLYGFGKTRISMFVNIVRLFAFRIPTLFFMMQQNIGIEAVGIAMLISNCLTGILASAVAFVFIKQLLASPDKDECANLM